jgi:hypothetical protein
MHPTASRFAQCWGLALCLLTTVATATDYYVGPGGSDLQSGTSGTPWASLQHAANQVGAGDTVHVQAGTYQGFDLRTSGTSGQPIRFLAQPGATINAVNGVTMDGINLEGASHVIIDGFNLESPNASTRAGIRVVVSDHVTLRNNAATNWGKWGIFSGFVDDFTVEHNTLSGSVEQHGIYASNSGDRPIIRYNHIFNNHANGIHINGDLSQGGDGVISDAVIEGNVIHGNGIGGGSGINADGAVNALIRNNLLYDNHASGISLYQIDGGAPSTGGVIVNNTILNATDARWAVNLTDGATGATVFNNILFNFHSFRGAISATEGSLAGLASDYNLLLPVFELDSFIDLATWQNETGQDLHSLALDQASLMALFANLNLDDYTLATGSDAVDFGVASLGGVLAPLQDLLQALRPAGAGFDAGAYELAAVPLPASFVLLAAPLLGLLGSIRRQETANLT